MGEIVDELMGRQHGCISMAQARAMGLSRSQVHRLVDSGRWLACHRGVYRATAAPPSWNGRVMAAVLATGGVASHRCAAALWRLDGWREPPAEVLVPHHKRSVVDVRLHRTTQWDRIDVSERDGIPATGIERTIIDLGAVVSARRLELAAESALRQRLVTWPSLRSCLIRHARRGRDGCGRLRALLDARYGDDDLPLSEWSRLVFHLLTDRGVVPPVVEHPVRCGQGRVLAQLDLAWPRERVGIELDSVRWHLNRASFERDRRKRNELRRLGWVILELTWSMTAGDPDGVAALAKTTLAARRNHSTARNWEG